VPNRYQSFPNAAVSGGRNGPRLSYEELQKRREDHRKARETAIQTGPALAALDPKEIDALMNRDEEDVEDSYQYVITDKVTVPRQKAAMLSIFNQEVEGKRVSIFNAKVQEKHPLLGFRLKNTTGQPLMQGPMMVHESGRYAGDARLSDTQVNEERLLAYAVDLGMEVFAEPEIHSHKVLSQAIRKGILITRQEQVTVKKYRVKNRSRQERTLVIEHPVRSSIATVVSKEKPYETARDVHRFEIKVAAGKTAVLEVAEQEPETQNWALQSISKPGLDIILAQTAATPNVKAALLQALEKRQALVTLDTELQAVDQQLKALIEDQARLRANIERVPKDSAVYKRYLEKFDTQETQLEKLQMTIQEKREALRKGQNQFEKFILDLNAE
jgi:hypothetical protein